jgi:chromosome segregation ATPase
MSRSHVIGTAAAVLLILSGAAAGRTSVQAQPAATPDVLPALLTEVKGLRAAMEQMAGAAPRVQLAVTRLQLQETRIAGMIRRLDTVRDALTTARRDLDRMKGSLKMFESDQEPAGPGKDDAAGMIRGLKREVTAAQANVDRLAAEETQLAGDLATEQARWTEINQRLDELERALAPRR